MDVRFGGTGNSTSANTSSRVRHGAIPGGTSPAHAYLGHRLISFPSNIASHAKTVGRHVHATNVGEGVAPSRIETVHVILSNARRSVVGIGSRNELGR